MSFACSADLCTLHIPNLCLYRYVYYLYTKFVAFSEKKKTDTNEDKYAR